MTPRFEFQSTLTVKKGLSAPLSLGVARMAATAAGPFTQADSPSVAYMKARNVLDEVRSV